MKSSVWALKYIIIVVATGNNFHDHDYDNYPINLFEDDARLINPATSALSITVGSVSPGIISSIDQSRHLIAGSMGFPSPFTRTGPGLDGMIKPDLVEIGGDLVLPADVDPTIGIVTTNKDFVGGDLFTVDNGTSFSCAKVSNLIAKLWNTFPSASSNLIKALLISSSTIPKQFLPDRLGQFSLERFTSPCCPTTIDSEEKRNLIYGYGLPNLKEAQSSDINKVILLDESTIKLDSAKFYEIPLPQSYYSTDGNREISVTLCFEPETRRTRGDSYLGCTMHFRLHRGSSLDELKAKYTEIQDDLDDIADPKEIRLFPGIRIRTKGCSQKGSVKLRRPRFSDESLQLAIICQNKWITDPEYQQKYAVVVRVIHEDPIDIYTPIKTRIEHRIRVRTQV
jgi:hypothetical protein